MVVPEQWSQLKKVLQQLQVDAIAAAEALVWLLQNDGISLVAVTNPAPRGAAPAPQRVPLQFLLNLTMIECYHVMGRSWCG